MLNESHVEKSHFCSKILAYTVSLRSIGPSEVKMNALYLFPPLNCSIFGLEQRTYQFPASLVMF